MPRIKALLDFVRTTPPNLLLRANIVYAGLRDSKDYSELPVDLAELRARIDDLAASISAALGGGKLAIAERNHNAEIVVDRLLQLAHHVEAHCKNDMTTFLASGFEPASSSRRK